MVFFTCSACGQAVKKNQVEKHCSFQCRNCQFLSCIDCGKDFWGNDYQSHSKCVSEDQKYGGKDYVAKASANKGEIRQEKWIEHIKSTIATKKLSGALSGLLNQIIECPNIPRKKAKFENFVQNSLRIRNPKLISDTWEIFAQGTKSEANVSSKENSTNATNGTASPVKRVADSDEVHNKKPRLEEFRGSKQNDDTFDWCGACEKILQKFPSGLPEKQLRKQVIAQYKAALGDNCSSSSNAELKKLFRKLLSNNSMFSLNANNSKESLS